MPIKFYLGYVSNIDYYLIDGFVDPVKSKSKTRLNRYFAPFSGLLALLAIVFIQFLHPPIIDTISLSVFDSFQRLAPRVKLDTPVRIVDIDEASLKIHGQWPWPRSDVAELIERLGNMGAAAIAFDMVFSEPDRTSPHRMARSLLKHKEIAKSLQLSDLPDNDAILAKSFANWPVIAGMVLMRQPNNVRPLVKPGFAIAGSDPRTRFPAYKGAIQNLAQLNEAARGLGYFSFEPDRYDRTVRRIPIAAWLGGKIYPSLLAETLRVAQGAGSIILKSSDASGETNWANEATMTAVKIGAFEIPTNENGEVWIYHAGHDPSRFVPAHKILGKDALNQAKLRAQIEGHIVYVGASAAGLLDIVSTPMSASTAGVEVQAEALEMVLGGQFLTRPDWAPGAEIVATLVFSLLLIGLMPLIGPLWCAILGGFLVALSIGGAWTGFSHYSYLFDSVYPVTGIVAVYLVVSGMLFLTAETERIAVRRAFTQYLAPELVEKLAQDPKALKLGGEERELTILFSDVRGFTALSEKLTSQEIAELMNAFFTPMSDALMATQATIDKYIGDAIMAFWNAPLDVENHPARACEAALEMSARLAKLRRERGIDMRMGIGLNTGICSVGNFGSLQRFNYSALGDPVNIAARIEGLTKLYGVDVLLGENTALRATGFAVLEIDLIKVVGKSRPEHVFALLGGPEIEATEQFQSLKTTHEQALTAYRSRKWAQAEKLFSAARTNPVASLNYEGLYGLYRKRIAAFKKRPPPKTWDGSANAESK
jgi:adenylate cyclase